MNRKLTSVLCCVLLIAAIFSGCSQSGKLPEGFDESTVKSTAESVVNYMSAGDYQAITDMTRDDLKDGLTPEVLSSAAAQVMSSSGTFVSFDKEVFSSTSDQTTDEKYAVAVINAKYENQTVTYTISLDSNMKLVGFYIK